MLCNCIQVIEKAVYSEDIVSLSSNIGQLDFKLTQKELAKLLWQSAVDACKVQCVKVSE